MRKKMKKLLVFLVMMSLMAIMPMVIGDDQTVIGGVSESVSFELITTSVDYGTIAPGGNSGVQANQIRVDASNNVNFNVDIKLSTGSNELFKNIYFDIDGDSVYEDTEKLNDATLVLAVTDQVGEFTVTVNSRLSVSLEQAPITGATGTITYTITGTTP